MFNNKIPFSFPVYGDCDCDYNHSSDCDYNLKKGVYMNAQQEPLIQQYNGWKAPVQTTFLNSEICQFC